MRWKSDRRGVRRWNRFVKMTRRLKEDFNQHYNDLECPCRSKGKVQSQFADTPTPCSCYMCGNPRRHFKGDAKLPLPELRARDFRESFTRRKKLPKDRTRSVKISCKLCGIQIRTETVLVGDPSHQDIFERCLKCTRDKEILFWFNGRSVLKP